MHTKTNSITYPRNKFQISNKANHKIKLLFLFLIGSNLSVHATEIPPVDCIINPYRIADISSAVPGVLDIVNVERSDWVEKGAVIARLASGVEQANVALAKARSEIESEIQLGETKLLFDKKRLSRIEQLHTKKSVSEEKYEEAGRNKELSIWELQQAKDLKSIRGLELVRAEEQLKQKTIRAPFDGFILQKFRSEGEYIENQAIVRVAQLDPLLIEAIVPMEVFGQIKVGMKGTIYPELSTDQPKVAEVVAVDRMGDAASRTFGVRLQLPNPEFALAAGLKCEMKFQPLEKETDSSSR